MSNNAQNLALSNNGFSPAAEEKSVIVKLLPIIGVVLSLI